MRNLLLTTALVMPLSIGAAFAQHTPAPAQDPAAAPMTETSPEKMEPSDAARPAKADDADVGTVIITDDDETDDDDAAAISPSAEEKLVRDQKSSELLVDWVTGATVTSPDGETVGEIEDVIVDKDSGKVTGAILSVGGFLGIGSKDIAVAWDELQIDYDAQEISIDLTREDAEAAPEYAYRDQEDPPAPAGTMGTTGTGMGTTGTGMGATGGATGTTPPTAD